jgi:hypothetical protein
MLYWAITAVVVFVILGETTPGWKLISLVTLGFMIYFRYNAIMSPVAITVGEAALCIVVAFHFLYLRAMSL